MIMSSIEVYQLHTHLFQEDEIEKAYLYSTYQKCGNPRCRCATTPYRHGPYYRLAFTNRSSLYLSVDPVKAARKIAKINPKWLMLSQIFDLLVKVVDKHKLCSIYRKELRKQIRGK